MVSPSYVPQTGETTWRQACDREVGYGAQYGGCGDVSTLGKIDIQGPDAAQLLDFVYTNTFSTLKAGKVRYGLMLREDGYVLDDGTTARLGEQHYVMTTTTAAAGLVMRHLEFISQVLRPDLACHRDVGDRALGAVCRRGPKSRDVLNGIIEAPS